MPLHIICKACDQHNCALHWKMPQKHRTQKLRKLSLFCLCPLQHGQHSVYTFYIMALKNYICCCGLHLCVWNCKPFELWHYFLKFWVWLISQCDSNRMKLFPVNWNSSTRISAASQGALHKRGCSFMCGWMNTFTTLLFYKKSRISMIGIFAKLSAKP